MRSQVLYRAAQVVKIKLTARLGAVVQADVYTFFRHIYKMWVDCGLYPELNIEDVKDEVFDMAQPEDPLHITPRDLQVTDSTHALICCGLVLFISLCLYISPLAKLERHNEKQDVTSENCTSPEACGHPRCADVCVSLKNSKSLNLCRVDTPTSRCCTHCAYRLKRNKVEMQSICLVLLHALKKLIMVCALCGLC